MPAYPSTPLPSSVSPPAVIDPHWEFATDSGIGIRRVKHSRPLRRWTLEYLGKDTVGLRQIRTFLQQQRLGTLEFAWLHPTAADPVVISPTTPVTASYQHGLFTGQWVFITGSPNALVNDHVWQVTYIDEVTVTLNGSTASGIQGAGWAQVFVPRAHAVFQEDGTFPSPAILIGPEQVAIGTRRSGAYNFSVQILELY